MDLSFPPKGGRRYLDFQKGVFQHLERLEGSFWFAPC